MQKNKQDTYCYISKVCVSRVSVAGTQAVRAAGQWRLVEWTRSFVVWVCWQWSLVFLKIRGTSGEKREDQTQQQINSLPSFLSALSRNLAASSSTCTFFRKVLICSMWESLELKTSLKGQGDVSKSCWSKRDASESKKNSSFFKLLVCPSLLAISPPSVSPCVCCSGRRAARSQQWSVLRVIQLLSEGSSFSFFLFFSFLFFFCSWMRGV